QGERLTLEHLEERARTLAGELAVRPRSRSGGRAHERRVATLARILRQAYRTLAQDVHRGEPVPPAAEWLLDNFHLVEAELVSVAHDLPRSYYRELPKLEAPELRDTARVYAMALEVVRHSDTRVDARSIERSVAAYQAVSPLSLGELWAWPSALKTALLETLHRIAEQLLAARVARREAASYLEPLDAEQSAEDLPSLPEPLS